MSQQQTTTTRPSPGNPEKVECPHCHKVLQGIFYFTCLTPECPGNSAFATELCRQCRRPRYKCSC